MYSGRLPRNGLTEVAPHRTWFRDTVSHGIEAGMPPAVLASEVDESLDVSLRCRPHPDIHVRMLALR